MRVIFSCAGLQSRWKGYMGYHKHLVPIDGQPLLLRNILLFKRLFKDIQDIEICVSIPEDPDPKSGPYSVHDDIIFLPVSNPEGPAYKSLIPYYQGDTLILLGDVLFTEDCATKIAHAVVEYRESMPLVFGRKNASQITGCTWGELFAFYIVESGLPGWINAVLSTERLYLDGKITRFSGWEIISYIYAQPAGGRLIESKMRKIFQTRNFPDSFIEINDETDDFDYPEDYDRYLKRRS